MRMLNGYGQTMYVWRNIQLVRGRIVLFLALMMSAILLFAQNVFPYSSIGLLIIPLTYALGAYSYSSYLAWQGGSAGERAVTEALKGLPDSYVLLNGVVVPPNRGDTDHIVIGPSGFFVIESKNYGGRISCDGDTWKKTKVIRGVSQKMEIGSPSNQVKRNAKVLKDFILMNQEAVFGGKAPHIWVFGFLAFTNPDAELELINPTVDVVDVDDLCAGIMGAKTEPPLSCENVQSAARLILAKAG
ncbi:MAG: nuclease-related domain-containing protein [Candidatus Altiarchaeota archaeon]